MAFRIGSSAIRGEIDNRLRDHVTGRVWIKGCEQPIRLDLRGNCLRDIAGLRFTFECSPTETLSHPEHLRPMQEGVVGDMTASRKVNTWTIPFEEAWQMRKEGKEVPVKKANCMYLEWYSDANGRVVLETVDFRITKMSEPAWRMTPEGNQQQQGDNVEAIADFINRVNEALEQQHEKWSPEEDEETDEFEWEQMFRESDERTERYGKVIEKYLGHPDAEKLIAREMGWEWLDDALDADERGAFKEEKAAAEKEMADLPPLEPNPETEGVDWIRTDDGDIEHPLAHRAAEASHSMWKQCDELGLLGANGDEDIADMTFQAHMISAKLAGALNGLAYRTLPDPGFVVACTKRALKYVGATLSAMRKVEERRVLDVDRLQEFRKELFEVRQEMLTLMKRYREELG